MTTATVRAGWVRGRRIALALGVASVLVGVLVGVVQYQRPAVVYGIWPDGHVPGPTVYNDGAALELGVEVSTADAGEILAVRFWRPAGDAGPHTGSVWDDRGALLGTTTTVEGSAPGWATAPFDQPVRVRASGRYVVSYTTQGPYVARHDAFSNGAVQRTEALTAQKGVFREGAGFPNRTFRDSDYFVDVLFRPASGSRGPATTPTGTAETTPSAAAAPRMATAPAVTRTEVASSGSSTASTVTIRPPDGGTGYYGKFAPSLPTSASWFPLSVWVESVLSPEDVRLDQAAGLNTYAGITLNSQLSVVRKEGMYAMHDGTPGAGSETVAWMLPDEVDMWAGPGWGAWTGKYPGQGTVCSGAAGCGYTVAATADAAFPRDRRLRFGTFGKGVAFWESPEQAAGFVARADVVSADTYWFTDRNLCGQSEGGRMFAGGDRELTADECHRAANYGATVARVRSLVKPAGSKPVWAVVELGHPMSQDEWPTVTAPEVRAAVWSSLIAGARGIIYFNHSFGGRCPSQHILREPCYAGMRAAVTKLNAQIRLLAPVLNSPIVEGLTTATPGADVMTRVHGGQLYVFAAAQQNRADVAVDFSLPCLKDGEVTVLGESRSIPLRDGRFTDRFEDGNAVHLYRLPPGATCGLKD